MKGLATTGAVLLVETNAQPGSNEGTHEALGKTTPLS